MSKQSSHGKCDLSFINISICSSATFFFLKCLQWKCWSGKMSLLKTKRASRNLAMWGGQTFAVDDLSHPRPPPSLPLICPHVWLSNILISAFLTKTAEAEFVCPWQFRSVLINSLSDQFLQLNIHHQRTAHRPFTVVINEPASWIFLSLGLVTETSSKKQIARSCTILMDMSKLPPNLTAHTEK